MNPQATVKARSVSSMPMQHRLSVRLALLFMLTFGAVFIGGLVYDVFAAIGEGRQNDAIEQPAPIVINPKLKTDLQKAMAFDTIPTEVAVSDPFADRSGISGLVKTSGAAPARTVSGSAGSTSGATNSPSVARNFSGESTGNSGGTASAPEVSVNEATKARYENRMQRVRLGLDGGPESFVFAVDDLLPVGVVSGGSGQQEIMFYSQSADKTFSFPVGTRFFDGWLTELRPEGVVFTIDDRTRTMKMRSWGRSIKAGGLAANYPNSQQPPMSGAQE